MCVFGLVSTDVCVTMCTSEGLNLFFCYCCLQVAASALGRNTSEGEVHEEAEDSEEEFDDLLLATLEYE
jgi:hypothetical protein